MGNQCHHDTVPLISLYYTDRTDWNYNDCTDWNCTFLNNHTKHICYLSFFNNMNLIIILIRNDLNMCYFNLSMTIIVRILNSNPFIIFHTFFIMQSYPMFCYFWYISDKFLVWCYFHMEVSNQKLSVASIHFIFYKSITFINNMVSNYRHNLMYWKFSLSFFL